MGLSEGKPFMVIIVGRVLDRDEEGYVIEYKCPNINEIMRNVENLGGKRLFSDGCGVVLELDRGGVSVASKTFISLNGKGVFIATVLDLLYPFKGESFLRDVMETVSSVKNLLSKIFPGKEPEIIDVQAYNYPMSMLDIMRIMY